MLFAEPFKRRHLLHLNTCCSKSCIRKITKTLSLFKVRMSTPHSMVASYWVLPLGFTVSFFWFVLNDLYPEFLLILFVSLEINSFRCALCSSFPATAWWPSKIVAVESVNLILLSCMLTCSWAVGKIKQKKATKETFSGLKAASFVPWSQTKPPDKNK